MSGHWTPDEGDPDDDFSADASQEDAIRGGAEADPRLAEVSAWLAAAPVPVMPDGIEARISAALATEGRARTADQAQASDDGPGAGAPAAGTAVPDRTLFPPLAPARARVRRSRGPGRRLLKSGPLLLVVVVLAGFGFLISRGGSSSSSSADAGPAAGGAVAGSSSSASSAAAAAPFGSASSTAGPGRGTTASGTSASSGGSAASAVFTVTESGVSYRRATLAQQVAARLGGSPASTGEHPPSAALRGCVLHFTGGSPPALVDQSTYQGTPVYVLASKSRVWVVGRGCTMTKTELIVSVPLAR